MWARWLRSSTQVDNDLLQVQAETAHCDPLSGCVPGQYVTVCGVIVSVTLPGADMASVFTAEVSDGSAVVNISFIGRRFIPGLNPGRHLYVWGRLCTASDGSLTIFNPKYRLVAPPRGR